MTTFNFPELLACHTMLTRMGVSADDIFYQVARDPRDGAECFAVGVKRPGNPIDITNQDLPQALIATDPIDYARHKTVGGAIEALKADMVEWNKTSQEAREKFLENSRVRSQAVDVAALLASKGLLPSQPGK